MVAFACYFLLDRIVLSQNGSDIEQRNLAEVCINALALEVVLLIPRRHHGKYRLIQMTSFTALFLIDGLLDFGQVFLCLLYGDHVEALRVAKVLKVLE